MSGPVNFIRRLEWTLAKRRLPPHRIVNAADWEGLAVAADHGTCEFALIGRFDGLFTYRFTPAALYNFVRSNTFRALPQIPRLESSLPVSLPALDRAIAAHLNRRDWPLKRRADAIVYQSRFSRRMHREIGGGDPDGKPVHEILNGAPLDVFRPLTPASALPGGPHLAITAQFRIGKRLRDAVRVVNALRGHYAGARLHVYGDIDQLTRESLVDLDVSVCEFHGRVRSEQLPAYYAATDVGLSPSLFDACPNSVIEMLACGLPVVTTAASGAAELVPDPTLCIKEEVRIDFTEFHNFQRLPAIGVDAWCAAIEAVLDRRAHWRELSREHARRRFDIEVVADRYAAVVETAWEARKSRDDPG